MNDNPNEPTRVISARWILPITTAPIHGGWVRLQGQRIVELGSGRPPAAAQDLGDVAVLPGLVNSHTHLEFSDCDLPIGQPGVPLAKWIGQVITARGTTNSEKKQAAIAKGIAESKRAGVQLIGEIATPPASYPDSDINIISFAEVLGLSETRSDERLQAAIAQNDHTESGAWSPHAPYSTSRPTIQACVDRAKKTARPLAMHVAESPAERELLRRGTGPFADALKSIGVWQDNLFPWSSQPFVDLIDQLSASPRALLIHCNDLQSDEIQRLSQHDHMSVVYCPRTHAFFGYGRHPVAEMLTAGIRVALGTDSRASNPDLNLWTEVQYLLNHRPDIAPEQILAMATVHGADALGKPQYGRIATGANASLGQVSTKATKIDKVYADLAKNSYSPL